MKNYTFLFHIKNHIHTLYIDFMRTVLKLTIRLLNIKKLFYSEEF